MRALHAWLGLLAGGSLPGSAVASAACSDASVCAVGAAHAGDRALQAAAIDAAGASQPEATRLLQIQASPAATRRKPGSPVAESETGSVLRLPVSWVHVPKCGTSFINTLIHLPGVCPDVPEDLVVSKDTYPDNGWHWIHPFVKEYNVPDSCPGLRGKYFGHTGIDSQDGYDEVKGNFMIMLRQPEQRMIAAYLDFKLAARTEPPENLLDEARSWGGWPNTTLPTITEWMAYGSGCAVRMLTRKGHPCGGLGGPPTQEEVKKAKERLSTDFSFVGLTDDWPLSMCLLSAMFRVPCYEGMMVDTRPGGKDRRNKEAEYDTDQLEGMTDPYDGPLYAEALKLFNARLTQYNVTEASCKETCWRDAGLEDS